MNKDPNQINFRRAINYLNKHITKETVIKYNAKCIQLNERLKNLLDEIEIDNYNAMLDKEYSIYKTETTDERQERACKLSEWIEHPNNENDIINYAKLCMDQSDCCWYGGNMDRIQECKIYRLKGSDDIFICDVCFNTDLEYLVDKYIK